MEKFDEQAARAFIERLDEKVNDYKEPAIYTNTTLLDEPKDESSLASSYEAQDQASRVQHRISRRLLRIKFAWALFILLAAWLFVLITIIISHSVGYIDIGLLLYLSDFVIRSSIWVLLLYSIMLTFYKIICTMLLILNRMPQNLRRNDSIVFDELWSIHKNYKLSLHLSIFVGSIIALCCWSDVYAYLTPKAHAVPFISLQESILQSLIISTTVGVTSLFAAVIFWLFPRSNDKEKVEERETEMKSS